MLCTFTYSISKKGARRSVGVKRFSCIEFSQINTTGFFSVLLNYALPDTWGYLYVFWLGRWTPVLQSSESRRLLRFLICQSNTLFLPWGVNERLCLIRFWMRLTQFSSRWISLLTTTNLKCWENLKVASFARNSVLSTLRQFFPFLMTA